MDASETQTCRYCGEQVLSVAVKCRHCGEWLDEEARKQHPAPHREGLFLRTMNVGCAVIFVLLLAWVAFCLWLVYS